MKKKAKSFKIGGAAVKDAPGKLMIRITKRDVQLGATKNANACAAARALCRETGCEAAKVHLSRTYIKKDGKWLRYATPPALRAEIIAFDRGGTFEPGDYVVAPVQPTVRLNTPRKQYKKHKTSVPQRGNRQKNHVVSSVRQRMSVIGE